MEFFFNTLAPLPLLGTKIYCRIYQSIRDELFHDNGCQDIRKIKKEGIFFLNSPLFQGGRRDARPYHRIDESLR